MLVMARLVTGVAGAPGPGDGTHASRMLSLLNDVRETVGLGPLVLDAPATGVAVAWAEHLAREGTLSHNPGLVAEMPSGWVKLGENVGMGGDVEAIHRALVRSPTHYDNLVQAGFTRVGIAVVARDGLLYAVQDFLRYATDPLPPPAADPAAVMARGTTSTTSTTTTTTPGAPGDTPAPTEPAEAVGVVAPGPAFHLDAPPGASEAPDEVVAEVADGRFGFVLEQLRAWDRGR